MQRKDVSSVCESNVCLGERKAGESLTEQTSEAGGQKERYLLRKSEEQQSPRGCDLYCVSQFCTRELRGHTKATVEAPAGTRAAGPAATSHAHIVSGLSHPASHPLVLPV